VQTLNTLFGFVIPFMDEMIRLKFVSGFQIDVNRRKCWHSVFVYIYTYVNLFNC